MNRKFILDEEIQLIEGADFLNTKVYADNLKAVIENAPEKNSFTVGLFGEWGTGKSSIIKTVKEDLEKSQGKKIKFITYDSWKYSNDSFRRMFLLCMKDELKHTASKLMNSFYLNESEDVKIKKKFNLKNVLIIVSVLIVGLLIVNFIPKSSVDENWKLSLSMVISFFGIFITIFLKAFDELKVNIQKPHLFAPEQFEECFKEMVEKSVKHYSYVQKAVQFVTGNNFEKNIDRLVIVIDNIDRCHKEMAYELLTNIKNFLGNPFNIIFVIPVDDSALRKHILSSSKNNAIVDCDMEAEEFLRKFFNVTIRIKPYHSEEMFDFSEKINQKYKLGFSPNTIDIVSKEYARNPRRIIQFFNNLSVELRSFTDDFASKYETVICKLLIIREEFPDYYSKLALNSYILNHTQIEELKDYNDKYPGLFRFLNTTRVVTLNVEQTIIDKILSNSNVFSGISQVLLNSISSLEIDSVKKFIDDDLGRKNLVINYIITQLKKGIERNAFDSEVIPKFDFLTALNENHHLDSHYNIRIQELIYGNNRLEIIFAKNNLKTAITYCESTLNQNIKYLSDYLINKINKEIINIEQPDVRWGNALKIAIKTFNQEYALEKLQVAFKNYYTIDNNILEWENLSDLQVEYLVSEEMQIYMIDNISDFSENDWAYMDLVELTNLVKVSPEIANYLINKLNSAYPNFNFKTIQDINANLVNIISVLSLNNIDLNNNYEELSTLFNQVIADRMMPHSHPVHSQNRANDHPENFINQSNDDTIIVNNILYFCETVYRLSKGTISTIDVISRLIENPVNRKYINQHLRAINVYGPLVSFYDIIISDDTYETDSYVLLKLALTSKTNQNYDVSDVKLTTKLSECLNYIYTGDSRNYELICFLEELVSDERVKNIMISLIFAQSRENILKLSTPLQTLAIDNVLDGENIFNFENNIEFLKLVASHGGPKHIQVLTKLILKKLLQETQLNDAIPILKEVKRLSPRDANRIKSELENYQSNEIYQELISQALAHVDEISDEIKTRKKVE